MTSPKPKATATAPKGANGVGKRKIDWVAAERDFRTGQYSQVELARKHGMADATLCRRIKDDQKDDKSRWQQDLTLAVRQATNAALMAELVNADIKKGQEQGQGQVKTTILVAAEVAKNVILGHRTGLSQITEVKRKLLAQIEQAAENMVDLAEVIEMVRKPDDNGMDRANDALKKAMGRSALVDDLKKLADVDEKVRKGEREAFSIDGAKDEESGKPSGMTDAERAVKLAYLMSKVGSLP